MLRTATIGLACFALVFTGCQSSPTTQPAASDAAPPAKQLPTSPPPELDDTWSQAVNGLAGRLVVPTPKWPIGEDSTFDMEFCNVGEDQLAVSTPHFMRTIRIHNSPFPDEPHPYTAVITAERLGDTLGSFLRREDGALSVLSELHLLAPGETVCFRVKCKLKLPRTETMAMARERRLLGPGEPIEVDEPLWFLFGRMPGRYRLRATYTWPPAPVEGQKVETFSGTWQGAIEMPPVEIEVVGQAALPQG